MTERRRSSSSGTAAFPKHFPIRAGLHDTQVADPQPSGSPSAAGWSVQSLDFMDDKGSDIKVTLWNEAVDKYSFMKKGQVQLSPTFQGNVSVYFHFDFAMGKTIKTSDFSGLVLVCTYAGFSGKWCIYQHYSRSIEIYKKLF